MHIDTISLLPSDSTFAAATSCNPVDTGVFINDLSNQFGCDSVHIDTIALLPNDTIFEINTTCNENEADSIQQVFINQNGCDSIFVLVTEYTPSIYSVFPDFTILRAGETLDFSIDNFDSNLIYEFTASDGNECSPPCNQLSVTPNNDLTNYFFTLTDTSTSCQNLDTLTIELEYFSELNIPNIFTPNNDGENDIYKVYGIDIFEFSLMIFDRWGGKVFEITNLNVGWDGTFNNQPVQSGIYIGVIKATGIDAKQYEKTVNIKLVR